MDLQFSEDSHGLVAQRLQRSFQHRTQSRSEHKLKSMVAIGCGCSTTCKAQDMYLMRVQLSQKSRVSGTEKLPQEPDVCTELLMYA